MEYLTALESQAWALYLVLYRLIQIEANGNAVRYSVPDRKRQLLRLHDRAYQRFLRRQDSLFNYQPGGFALPPTQSSGVLG
jgi:hypothetical protein